MEQRATVHFLIGENGLDNLVRGRCRRRGHRRRECRVVTRESSDARLVEKEPLLQQQAVCLAKVNGRDRCAVEARIPCTRHDFADAVAELVEKLYRLIIGEQLGLVVWCLDKVANEGCCRVDAGCFFW